MGQRYILVAKEGIILDKVCPKCRCMTGWPRTLWWHSSRLQKGPAKRPRYLWTCANCEYKMYRVQDRGKPMTEAGVVSKRMWPRKNSSHIPIDQVTVLSKVLCPRKDHWGRERKVTLIRRKLRGTIW